MQRQQLVYKAIWEEMQGAVHAVDSMVCKTPDEAQNGLSRLCGIQSTPSSAGVRDWTHILPRGVHVSLVLPRNQNHVLLPDGTVLVVAVEYVCIKESSNTLRLAISQNCKSYESIHTYSFCPRATMPQSKTQLRHRQQYFAGSDQCHLRISPPSSHPRCNLQ